jgi:hypothetical protein
VRESVNAHPFIGTQLGVLERLLEPYLLQFGYRVFDEIAVFTHLGATNGLFGKGQEEAALAAFESAALMKVLPKFYGSRQRLEIPLLSLQAWAIDPDDPDAGKAILNTQADVDPRYLRLFSRTARMLADLQRDDFCQPWIVTYSLESLPTGLWTTQSASGFCRHMPHGARPARAAC